MPKQEARRLKHLLQAAGFVFVRREGHEVWRHPIHGIIVVPHGNKKENHFTMVKIENRLRKMISGDPRV